MWDCMRLLYKIFLSSLFAVIALSCTISKKSPKIDSAPSKVRVLSTIAMIDDLVCMVGGDRVDHSALISGEIDPHSYEIVKGDDEKISDADLVLFNGLGLEHGASLCYKIKKHPFSFGVADEVARLYPERILTISGSTDPHIWMDISLWSLAIDPITDALVKLDPAGQEYYLKRAEDAKRKMRDTHHKVYNLLQSVPSEKRYLVTTHDAFSYFTRGYLAEPTEIESGTWSKRFAAPEGLAPDGQLSTHDIQEIIDHLSRYKISVVFAESNVSRDSLKKIVSASREKKHDVNFSKRVLYGDAMGSFEDRVSSYLEMIEKNAQSLISEWQSQ